MNGNPIGYPNQVFFFADDHGWNSAAKNMGDVDKIPQPGDPYAVPDPDTQSSPAYPFGAGDSQSPPID
jgi:hypothetical protein